MHAEQQFATLIDIPEKKFGHNTHLLHSTYKKSKTYSKTNIM